MIINAYFGVNLIAPYVQALFFIQISAFRNVPTVDDEFFVNFEEIS